MKRCSALPLVLVGLLPGVALAQDAFEIEVYDAQTAAPGQVGVELHVNHFLVGSTQADVGGAPGVSLGGTVAAGRERPTNHVTHLTIEPHVGLADWCEAGMYISTALRADGTYDYAGIKLRFKARLPWKLGNLVGLALNNELSATRPDYEAGIFAWEVRPIVDFEWSRLYLSVNPIIAVPLGGGSVSFEPGAKAAVRVAGPVSLGAEYYGAFGTGAGVNRLFGAVDVDFESGRLQYEVNLGLGYGFSGPEKWIVKAVFAVDLEPRRS
jgi:hypothetical protein